MLVELVLLFIAFYCLFILLKISIVDNKTDEKLALLEYDINAFKDTEPKIREREYANRRWYNTYGLNICFIFTIFTLLSIVLKLFLPWISIWTPIISFIIANYYYQKLTTSDDPYPNDIIECSRKYFIMEDDATSRLNLQIIQRKKVIKKFIGSLPINPENLGQWVLEFQRVLPDHSEEEVKKTLDLITQRNVKN